MKIAVTGGTGFLGREIAFQAAALGHEISCIGRGNLPPGKSAERISFQRCDIHDSALLATLFEGHDVVIHCAALSSPWGARREFLYQNVAGTASVVQAATTAKIRRLVHISSSSVYFDFADQFNLAETIDLPPPINAYAESKQKAEKEASKFSGYVFILRPRGIFGPGDLHLMPRLLKVMQRGRMPLLRDGKAIADITDVAVVADAVLCAAQAPAARAGTYNVSQGSPIAITNLVEHIGSAMGIAARWRKLPIGVALLGARVLEIVGTLDSKKREPLVTAYSLGLFAYSQTLDITAARDSLGWVPKLTMDESLNRTLRAFKENANAL